MQFLAELLIYLIGRKKSSTQNYQKESLRLQLELLLLSILWSRALLIQYTKFIQQSRSLRIFFSEAKSSVILSSLLVWFSRFLQFDEENVPIQLQFLRRFLLEYLINIKNLSRNTQQSYRDTFRLYLPEAAKKIKSPYNTILANRFSYFRCR